MRSTNRTNQFKILAGVILGLMLAILVYNVVDLARSTDEQGIALNKAINDRNMNYAKANSFGFTDKERTRAKPKGIYRIAVLGDSFIWGDGLPYEKIWSHKLERRLLAQYDSVEVISWGKGGWSTLDEFNFFKQHSKDFGIDLLIIGWVDNDPDMGNIKQVEAGDAQKKYPLIYKIYPALAQSLLNGKNTNLYSNWMDKLYGQENLKAYQTLLAEFNLYLKQNGTPVLIVMTPGGLDPSAEPRFNAVMPLLQQAGFTYLNLLPGVKKKLGHHLPSELMANPVNQHPGDLVTEEICDDVMSYLENNGYLKNLRTRRAL